MSAFKCIILCLKNLLFYTLIPCFRDMEPTNASDTNANMRPSGAETLLLIGYNVIVVLSSLLGDTIILIATMTDGSFRLNKISALTATKLTILKFPLKYKYWKKEVAHGLCAALCLVWIWVPL